MTGAGASGEPRGPRARSSLRGLLLAAASLALLAIAWGAIAGALGQIPASRTAGQRVETTVQLISGGLALMVLLTSFRLRRWSRPVRIAWAASLATAAGLSSLVWGPPLPGVALAFVALALLVAGAIVGALRAGTRGFDRSDRPAA